MRRAVLTSSVAVAIALALAVALPAWAIPPPPATALLEQDIYGNCVVGTPYPSPLVIGQGIIFQNDLNAAHTVRQQQGFWNVSVPTGSGVQKTVHAAGTYPVDCDAGPYNQNIPVAITGPASTSSATFTLTWADSGEVSTWTHTVQYRKGTTGSFITWKNATTLRSATFTAQHNTTYYFRAFVTRVGLSTPYSPLKKVVVT